MPRPGADFDEAAHPPVTEDHPLLARAASAGAAATQWGFDFAWQNLSDDRLVRLLQANGAQFACRYINDPGGKGITSSGAAALDAAGIIIAPVYETTGTDFTGGYAAGMRAGATAAALLRARGAPAGSWCWFAIDTGTSSFSLTNAYLRGAKAGTAEYIAQLYGSYDVVEAAFSAGLGDKHWQTYAWSAGKLSAHAALYQYQNGVVIGGVSMDRDRTLTRMNGPWAGFGAPPPPPPPPPSQPPDWTEQAIMSLPTVGPSDTDNPGEMQYVHRVQALVRVIGQVNNLAAAAGVATDGIYGPATVSGVRQVQGFFGLSQDGICGQGTWTKLIGA
jgi:peptidoglycan hydrolase-like protein with peptidoglycan-binding domain